MRRKPTTSLYYIKEIIQAWLAIVKWFWEGLLVIGWSKVKYLKLRNTCRRTLRRPIIIAGQSLLLRDSAFVGGCSVSRYAPNFFSSNIIRGFLPTTAQTASSSVKPCSSWRRCRATYSCFWLKWPKPTSSCPISLWRLCSSSTF